KAGQRGKFCRIKELWMAGGAVELRPLPAEPHVMKPACHLPALAGVLLLGCAGSASAQSRPAPATVAPPPLAIGPLLRADLRLDKTVLQMGQPVWAELSLTNLSDATLPLQVAGAEPDNAPRPEMGLPLAHVFSGKEFTAVQITDAHSELMDNHVSHPPRGPVPVVHLAPHASVGARINLAQVHQA